MLAAPVAISIASGTTPSVIKISSQETVEARASQTIFHLCAGLEASQRLQSAFATRCVNRPSRGVQAKGQMCWPKRG